MPELSPLGSVKASVVANQVQLDVDVTDPALREGLGVAAPPPALPAGFPFPTPVTLIRERDGSRNAIVDTPWLPDGLTVYTAPWALSTGAGTTADPVRLREALAVPGVKRVVCAPGVYDRLAIPASGSLPSVSIVCPSGRAIVSTHERPSSLAWSVNTPMVATYKCARSTVLTVRDEAHRTPFGDSLALVKRTSAAAVDASPGSWYSDGTTLYVRTIDSRPPDAQLRAYLGVQGIRADGVDLNLYGIEFHGGDINGALYIRNEGGAAKLNAEQCAFRYSPLGNGLTAWGVGIVKLRDCTATSNQLDGLNYHARVGAVTNAIEINCESYDNGFSGSNSDNASSMHDGGSIIRVGGRYEAAGGRNVVDISDNTQSFNWGCDARNSRGGVGHNIDYEAGQPGALDATRMWLVECRASGSTLSAYVNDVSTIYYRDNAGITISGPGAALPYA